MDQGMWKPAGFEKALTDSGWRPEELAVELQGMGWNTSIHAVLRWKSERTGGPKHLAQVRVIADLLGCKVGALVKGAGRS